MRSGFSAAIQNHPLVLGDGRTLRAFMSSDEIRRQLQEHHESAFGWALGCCAQEPAEAEDLLQTVYLKILQGRARYNGKAAFKTWLYAVIRKTAADARRRRMVRDFRLSTFRQPRQG